MSVLVGLSAGEREKWDNVMSTSQEKRAAVSKKRKPIAGLPNFRLSTSSADTPSKALALLPVPLFPPAERMQCDTLCALASFPSQPCMHASNLRRHTVPYLIDLWPFPSWNRHISILLKSVNAWRFAPISWTCDPQFSYPDLRFPCHMSWGSCKLYWGMRWATSPFCFIRRVTNT